MSQTVDAVKITATRHPYRRAGLDLRAPVTLAADALSDAQREKLMADPVVHIEALQIPADQIASADAEPVKLPTKKADLQDWLAEAGVEFTADETVARLTEKAKAYLAEPAEGSE